MSPRRSPEPLFWLAFSAGGMAAAFGIPVLLFLFGVAFPLGWLTPPDHADLIALVRHPITRLVLFGLAALALLHWAHRFRYTLYDGLQLKRLHTPITIGCYGAALAGTAIAAYLLIRV